MWLAYAAAGRGCNHFGGGSCKEARRSGPGIETAAGSRQETVSWWYLGHKAPARRTDQIAEFSGCSCSLQTLARTAISEFPSNRNTSAPAATSFNQLSSLHLTLAVSFSINPPTCSCNIGTRRHPIGGSWRTTAHLMSHEEMTATRVLFFFFFFFKKNSLFFFIISFSIFL